MKTISVFCIKRYGICCSYNNLKLLHSWDTKADHLFLNNHGYAKRITAARLTHQLLLNALSAEQQNLNL